MRLRLGGIGISLVLLPAIIQAQTQRLEMHPFPTVTLTAEQFLAGANDGTPAVIAAELRLPRMNNAPLPAVILVHGSSGVGPTVDGWARELKSIGVAALLLDSFTGRGITSTGSDQSQLHHLAMIEDAYRALDWLARDSRVDRSRIALMGFSKGGFVALQGAGGNVQRLVAGTRSDEGGALLSRAAADEREGTYVVELSHAGYANWQQSGVRVSGNGCHVETAHLQAHLVRVLQRAAA